VSDGARKRPGKGEQKGGTTKDAKSNYLLRGIDPHMWTRFKSRSDDPGVPMRTLILMLVGAYVDGRVSLTIQRADRR
jgi:hypothetical protein